MTVTDRIDQLEKRKRLFWKILRQAGVLDEDTYDRVIPIIRGVEGQIQSLKCLQKDMQKL
jgi:hypothetical protein